jgi:HEAT repeat protein
MLADTSSLEGLLTSHDPQIRLAVAEALVILGAQSGPQTLDLLAHDNDIDTRLQTAQLMGRHPDRRYIPPLIGLLDDTLGVRTAALASLPEVVGRDVADRPDDPPTSTLERVERWKKWWQLEKGQDR